MVASSGTQAYALATLNKHKLIRMSYSESSTIYSTHHIIAIFGIISHILAMFFHDPVKGESTEKMVFALDFGQTLPVTARGTRADIIKASLKSSPLWTYVQNLHLRINMRVYLGGGNAVFPSKLLSIGNKNAPNNGAYISMEDSNAATVLYAIDGLISKIYPQIGILFQKPYEWLCERSIIAPRNIFAFDINNIVLIEVPATFIDSKSIDSVISNNDDVLYST